jgi:hypothetical protein
MCRKGIIEYEAWCVKGNALIIHFSSGVVGMNNGIDE